MTLPSVIQDIILDYYDQLWRVELYQRLQQHAQSMTVLEELLFAHRHYTTYRLEFYGTPPIVIRNLERIRGVTPQEWTSEKVTTRYKHPKINAILNKCLQLPNMI